MLRAADVSFAYGAHRVLDRVDISIRPGTLVGILGPNGAGKTTLLSVLGGLVRPSRGEVTLDGVALARLSRVEIARRMAIVPQDTHLAFDYSVLEVVLMGRYPHLGPFELEGPSDLEIARQALASTGTSDLERRSFLSLSGGEKQRVIIASALAQLADAGRHAPPDGDRPSRVLLLDEPTAALDPAYQLEIADILRDLGALRHLTIAVCTHDLNFAAGLCGELVMLQGGRVIMAGPTDRVLTPETVRRLYGIDAEVQRLPATGHLSVVPLRRVAGGPAG